MSSVKDAKPAPALRTSRQVSEREIAIALVLEMAQLRGNQRIALMGFYDDDHEFLVDLARVLNVEYGKPWFNKLTKVVRCLVNHGVLHSEMRGTHKEYIGEPSKQMEYWLRPGKAHLLRQPYKAGVFMGPEDEASFLLRRAYPEPETE